MIDCECKKWQDSNCPVNEHHQYCPQHPSHAKEVVYCLICDKELVYEPGPDHNGNVHNAGFMLVSFHYESRHDQCHGFSGRKSHREEKDAMHRLLSCDEIEAFICDDCFEKKFDKMKGYDVQRRADRIKKV